MFIKEIRVSVSGTTSHRLRHKLRSLAGLNGSGSGQAQAPDAGDHRLRRRVRRGVSRRTRSVVAQGRHLGRETAWRIGRKLIVRGPGVK